MARRVQSSLGGLYVVHIIYENWGLDEANSLVLFTSYGSRWTREQITTFWNIATFDL